MGLSASEQAVLDSIHTQLSIVADLSRAEGLLYGPLVDGKTTVLAHFHPHSVAPVYQKNYTGRKVSFPDMPVVIKAMEHGRKQQGQEGVFGDKFSVVVETWPIFSPDFAGQVIGAVSIDTNLLESERQRSRSKIFQRTLRRLQNMMLNGTLKNAEVLSPFDEQAGLIVVDPEGRIRYTSGIAANLYRRIGYLSNLIGQPLESLTTGDDKLFTRAISTMECVEAETENNGRHWVRKVIPIWGRPTTLNSILRQLWYRVNPAERLAGALIVVRDITEERRKEQEMRVKNAMIQEIHHRVKNNLQTIAALLRIQTRRVKSPDALSALQDAIKRILSVAVIHEFLSDQEAWTINIKDVCQRIIAQTKDSIVGAESKIAFALNGPSIWLPARQATACALVINELLQNSLEHGFLAGANGQIDIALTDEGNYVIIIVSDNGQGLPSDFNPQALHSLGLQIAKTLVTEDLQGELTLSNNSGTVATITFPKAVFGGEEVGPY